LVYQSDLCRVLAEALEQKAKQHPASAVVQLDFDCAVSSVDFSTNTIIIETATNGKKVLYGSSFDLIVGCDGVNSVVRQCLQTTYGPYGFQSNVTLLPGVFKVARLPTMPPQLDRTAVQLLLPKSGSATAFCEPVIDGACCLLIAGTNETDVLLRNYNDNDDDDPAVTVADIADALRERFPQLAGIDFTNAAQQLVVAKQGRASKVSCNMYHAQTACLVGDAAHATGGVSGQGLNSALADVSVLVDCLCRHYDDDNDDDEASGGDNRKASSIQTALLEYSQRAVPEGTALADLAFRGRDNIWTTVLDFVFRGRFGIGQPILQTQLTSSRRPFASIRRDRQNYYNNDEVFPSPQEWEAQIQMLHQRLLVQKPPKEESPETTE
jgi:kynurenine 3-monooxygenase